MEGSGHPYGLTTIHACLPAHASLPAYACQCPMPVRAKSCREGGRSAAALQRSLQSPPVHGPWSIYGGVPRLAVLL
jgi:hypothetical protein